MNENREASDSDDESISEEFELEDLVVALPHRRLVEQELRELRLWPRDPRPEQIEESPALGLALLRGLQNLQGQASGFTGSRDSGRSFTDLDAVLAKLRSVLAEKYGGWVPDLGKNRHVGRPVTVVGGVTEEFLLLGGCRGHGCIMFNPHALGLPEPVRPPDLGAAAEGQLGSGVRIGLIDTQLYPHPRLRGHISGDDFAAAEAFRQEHGSTWLPWEGHGTFVADVMLQQAPAATIVPRALDHNPNGRVDMWEVATKLAGFAGTDVRIVNLSLGCRTADGEPPLAISQAIHRLGPDVLVVAAAGNHGRTTQRCRPVWPGALPDVVAVGATGADFSPTLPWVSCTAKGSWEAAYLDETVIRPTQVPPRLLSGEQAARLRSDAFLALHQPAEPPMNFDGFARWNGSSFAAAAVSGAVAAALTGGRTAREALDGLLEQAGGVVRKFEGGPCWPP